VIAALPEPMAAADALRLPVVDDEAGVRPQPSAY
jgi:hypothetical protein